MRKKILFIVLGIIFTLLILFLVGRFNFLNEQSKFAEKWNVVTEGLTLIKEGKYEEGLNRCSEFTYYNTNLCHAAVFLTKRERNESISLEFCESIPTELKENYPLTIKIFSFFENPNAVENFRKESLDLIEQCKQLNSAN